jgi:hypothetical protein
MVYETADWLHGEGEPRGMRWGCIVVVGGIGLVVEVRSDLR